MSNKSAYIRTQPNKIEFSLPFSDGSGERLRVVIDGKQTDVGIHDITECVNISVEDIKWLVQALEDIQNILEMKKENS